MSCSDRSHTESSRERERELERESRELRRATVCRWQGLLAPECIVAVSTQSVSTAALHWVVENVVATVGTDDSTSHHGGRWKLTYFFD